MSIQWGRVVLAAFVMEVILIAIAVPLALSGYGDSLAYVIPPAALIATFATPALRTVVELARHVQLVDTFPG